jgi:hypothetical protein
MVMKNALFFIMIIFILVSLQTHFLHAQLQFDPVALTDENVYLFSSREIISGIENNRTLFYGSVRGKSLILKQ